MGPRLKAAGFLRLTPSLRPSVQARIRLAQVFSMPEREVSRRVEEIELDPLFSRLIRAGVVRIEAYPNVRFIRRDMASLLPISSGNPDPLQGDDGLASMIRRIGEQAFEVCFLADSKFSDEERATRCGISEEDACRIRHLVDRAFVEAQFETRTEAAKTSDSPTPGPIGGIQIEDGRPVLAFYHREIWKGQYRVDEARRAKFLKTLSRPDGRDADQLLTRIRLMSRRTASLYRVLRSLIDIQSDFLSTERHERLRPLSQRKLAGVLGIDSGTVSKLLSGKSIVLPTGARIPLNALTPGSKALQDQFYDMFQSRPELTVCGLADEFLRIYGIRLSKRSVIRYRQQSGLMPVHLP